MKATKATASTRDFVSSDIDRSRNAERPLHPPEVHQGMNSRQKLRPRVFRAVPGDRYQTEVATPSNRRHASPPASPSSEIASGDGIRPTYCGRPDAINFSRRDSCGLTRLVPRSGPRETSTIGIRPVLLRAWKRQRFWDGCHDGLTQQSSNVCRWY
jgi:hypothetical protein